MDHIGPRQYEQYEASLVAPVLYQRILFSGSADNQITIQDTPTTSGEIISFPYMSCQWIKPKTWVTGTVTVQGEYVWYNGRTYKNTTTASGAAYGATPPTHTTGTVNDGGVNWDYYAQPLTRFTADTDEPLFHPELIAKGIEYKFLEKTGLDFGRAEAEYVRFRDAVKPNLSGASKIRLGKRRHRMRGEGSIPEGSWAL